MALDVGIVRVEYLSVPRFPVEAFFRDLMLNPELGLDEDDLEDDEYWDGGNNAGNAFYEFEREGLAKRANGWATKEKLGSLDRENLLKWVENLPYRSDTDTIMLHLSV